ncbi:MAG: hypothetical protein AMS19_05620 [Gemmatimonas sp. SG8_23]|nr:MAG: hypothetical protein AMS19_05620 [Gemmatimonas sp. SG8_23]
MSRSSWSTRATTSWPARRSCASSRTSIRRRSAAPRPRSRSPRRSRPSSGPTSSRLSGTWTASCSCGPETPSW